MKNTIYFSLLSIGLVTLSACNAAVNTNEAVESAMPVLGEEGSSVSEMIVEEESSASSIDNGDDGNSADAGGNGGTVTSAPAARTISVSVDNWAFTPAAITVKKGENIMVKLTDVAGTHSFAVPGLGINQALTPGQVTSVSIPTDKPGTYEFRCMIPCGEGHKEMRGTLVIEE